MSRKSQREGNCVYCGKYGPISADHVIPRCLFPLPLPDNLVTVVACNSCNNEKSKGDGYLRDLLVTDAFVCDDPVADKLMKEKVMSAVVKNKSHLITEFMQSARSKPFYSDAGIYLGNMYQARLNNDKVRGIFTWIVKGLYFKLRNCRLPDNCEVRFGRVNPMKLGEAYNEALQLKFNGPYGCGDVFQCLMQYAEEEPNVTFWYLFFYKRIGFWVSTAPEGGIESVMKRLDMPTISNTPGAINTSESD